MKTAPRSARPARAALLVWSLFVFVLAPAFPTVAAAPLDADAELKVIKTAYTDIFQFLYTTPDTTALLTNAHAEVEKQLHTQAPLDALGDTPTGQYDVFARNFRTLVAQAGPVELARGDLAHAVIQSMTKTVNDKHTYFLNVQQADDVRRRNRGDTSIINYGIISANVGGEAYVKQVVEGSPALAGGIRPADHLIALDGQTINWENRPVVLAAPQEGSTHQFTVQHAGDAAPTMVSVTIKRYTRTAVASSVLDGHIGYIQAFAFYKDIPQKLDDALTALHQQHVDSLLIDFRGNGGGTGVEQVMGRFLPNDTEIGASVGRKYNGRFVVKSNGHDRETLPVVVLVDEGSGSASEIAALAFREFAGVQIVGAKTAGAVGSTAPFELGDDTMLSVTVSEYVTAKGTALNKVGVTPDIVVERTPDDVLAGRDPQLDAARNALTMQTQPIALRPVLACAA